MLSLGESVSFAWREKIEQPQDEQFWDTVLTIGNRLVVVRNAAGGHGTRVNKISYFNVKTGKWWRVFKTTPRRVFGGFLVNDQIYMLERDVSNRVLKFDTVLEELSWCRHSGRIGWEHCSLGVEYIEQHNTALAICNNDALDPVIRVLDMDTLTWSMPCSVGATPVIDPTYVTVTTRFGWNLPRRDGIVSLFEPYFVAATRPIIDPSTVATTSFGNTVFIYLGKQLLLLHCIQKGTFRWSVPTLFGIPKCIKPTFTYVGAGRLALVGCGNSERMETWLFSPSTSEWTCADTRKKVRTFNKWYDEQMAAYVNNQLAICGGRNGTKVAFLEGLNA